MDCPSLPDECVDDDVVTYAEPTRDDSSGEAVCAWEASIADGCADQGLVCIDAACIFPELIWEDHATIDSELDVEALENVTVIEGNLVLGDDIEQATLDHLHTIEGSLIIDQSSVSALSLPALTSIGALLYINKNQPLSSLDLPALTSVGSHLTVFANGPFASLALPALETVGGKLTVAANVGLATADLPALNAVGGLVLVHDNDALQTLAADALATTGAELRFTSNPALEAVALPGLTDPGGPLAVRWSPSVTAIDLSGLETAEHTVAAEDLASLTDVDAGSLTASEASIALRGLPLLATLDLTSLETVTGTLMLAELPALTDAALTALQTVGGDLIVRGTGAGTPNCPVMTSTGGALAIQDNPAIETFDPPLLETVGGSLIVSGNATLTTLSLPALASTGYTADTGFATVEAPGGPIDSGVVSTHVLIGEARTFDVVSNQWMQLTQITDLEDQDVSDLVDADCTLGDTVLKLEVEITHTEHVLTTFEYTKDNNSKGVMLSVGAPAGGWEVGWNALVVSVSDGNYVCSEGEGCTDICETPWDDMHRLELYKSGPQPPVIQDATIGIRNVVLSRFGKLGSKVQGKSLAIADNAALTTIELTMTGADGVSIAGNASLPQCLVDWLLTQITKPVASVTTGDNLDGCFCSGDPPVADCLQPPAE